MRFEEGGTPVVVTASKAIAAHGGGRPERTNVWLNPPTAR